VWQFGETPAGLKIEDYQAIERICRGVYTK